jgi:hypothetical protein
MIRRASGSKRLLKNSHLAAVLESPFVRRSAVYALWVLRLRRAFCGCDDLTIFEQPKISAAN